MSLSRRDFIKSVALFGAMHYLSPAVKLFAEGETVNYYENYLAALETPYTAPMNEHFEILTAGHTLGLILYDLNNSRLMTALSSEKPLPVASAFKAGLILYFVDQVDASVWGTVPVEYWNAKGKGEVPEEFQASWHENRAILQSLYQTLVLSDNFATGVIMSYVAKAQGGTDAVSMFNDWAHDTVGISQLSGLSGWSEGVESGMTFFDERYKGSQTSINSQLVTLENMMTSRDLGLFYVWMLTYLDEAQQQVCKDILSIIFTNRGANLERLAQQFEGKSYSKNGSLATDAGYVVTDAGIIDLPDGTQYLLVVESIHPQDTTVLSIVPELFEDLHKVLAGHYNELLHNRHYDGITPEELKAIYLAHLQVAYTDHGDSDEQGLYRYGFIIPEGVDIYRHPDEDSKLHNPIIKTTFGVHLLMQGALVRYVDVDDTWVELMPDDERDNVRSRLGIQVFIKREDVWSISSQYANPIPYLIDDVPADDKYICINVSARELVAFEGATPILKVPIVLNPDATPRGAQIITSKWFARSMQPWAPGVPFTSFFGNDGFALHGSPWQRWTSTVNQETIMGRTSAGCVNIPDWLVTVGEYTRPADELIFRWVGGMENQRTTVFDYPSDTYPALRIFSVDYLQNLKNYYMPANLVNQGITWDSVAQAMESTPLQAPDSFFV